MISVLIPTRDRPRLLEVATASARGQQGVAVEVIVEHDPNQTGQSATVNRAARRATGQSVAVLHDDDYYLTPDALAVLQATLEAHPDAAAVYSLPQYVDAVGAPLPTPARLAEWMAAHPTVRLEDIGAGMLIHGGGWLYRRTWWDQAGPWDASLPACQEYEFHLRLLSMGATVVACPTLTVAYRRHPAQMSRRGGPIGRRSTVRQQIRQRIRERYQLAGVR